MGSGHFWGGALATLCGWFDQRMESTRSRLLHTTCLQILLVYSIPAQISYSLASSQLDLSCGLPLPSPCQRSIFNAEPAHLHHRGRYRRDHALRDFSHGHLRNDPPVIYFKQRHGGVCFFLTIRESLHFDLCQHNTLIEIELDRTKYLEAWTWFRKSVSTYQGHHTRRNDLVSTR